MAQDNDKVELITELARTRALIASNAQGLRHDLDFSTRAKKAFKSSPWPWVGGATLLGMIVARLAPRRAKTKPVVIKHKDQTVEKAGKMGLILGIIKIVLDFAKPAIATWARKRVTDYMARRGDYPRPR